MNAIDLSFLVGLGRTPDDHALDLLSGSHEEARASLEYLDANLRSSLLAAAVGVLRDLDAAEDAVQCALLELLRNRASSASAFARLSAREGQGVSAFAFLRAQLLRTVYRRSLDRLRRVRRLTALDEAASVEMPLELADPLLHKLLLAALAGLDAEARVAIASRFAGCETHDEAAEFMGTTRAAAAAAWRRAVYRLRQAHALASYVAPLRETNPT